MNIGIVGLGLIGGSLAKSIRKNTNHNVYGNDIDSLSLKKARMVGAIDRELTEEDFPALDLLILALYPGDTIPFLQSVKGALKEGSLVMDTAGVKRRICKEGFKIAQENGFIFVGGHPMAGLEFSGFDASTTSLFVDASMILIPPANISIGKLEFLKELFLTIGFNNIEIASPEKHDRIIALSSQLAHVVSSAYIQSPQAMEHRGFSAGSFHDMTRVAKLNEELWSQLFFANKDFLANEIDSLVERLTAYSKSIKDEDREGLYQLLAEGHRQRLKLE